MKRIALWAVSTVVAVGLLLGYRTSTEGVPRATATAAAGVVAVLPTVPVPTVPVPTVPPPASGPSDPAAPPTPAASRAATTTVVNGAAVPTRYGDVQVQITVTGRRVVKAVAIAYSTDGRDGEINGYAIPVLQAETVTASSAQIDSVSGATFTSEGYRTSLQSALDAAGL